MFEVGDKVRIINPHPENGKYFNRTGVINSIEDSGMSGYDYTVRGLDSRIKERIMGFVGVTEDELSRA